MANDTATRATGRIGAWHRTVAAALRGVYFGHVPVTGTPLGPRTRPRVFVSSHRNGAIDGLQVLRATPDAQFLVSIQLLRNPVLRLFFTGIPVVRAKDVERYGLARDAVADPVEASRRHVHAGGDIVIFPEGTSEWGHAPGRYRRGAARLVRVLADDGVDVDVVPIGLFYSAPDRFRSRADVHLGPVMDLPGRDGREDSAWESALHERIGAGLDDVSVNCPDEPTFERVQTLAIEDDRAGAGFADAFLRRQAEARTGRLPDGPSRPSSQLGARIVGIGLMAIVWPVLAIAWLVGRRADGRNTVTFFRMLGGAAATVLWLPVVGVLATIDPPRVLGGLALAALGWLVLGIRRRHL